MIKEQNQTLDKNDEYEYFIQKVQSAMLENACIDISTYEDLFSIIDIISKRYIFPNIETLPKKYKFNPSIFQIEVGTKYKRRDKFEETLYFAPAGSFGSFISTDIMMGLSTYDLKEIFYDLYPPQQILSDFYKTLMTFAKNNKQQIKGLKLPLQFMKIILENEEECKS